jgi:tRNA1Val (adenine37-N6)-methyltransferase
LEAEIISLAKENDLRPLNILRIRTSPGKDFKRVLMEFSFSPGNLKESEMIIENGLRHQYSEEYLALTKDFYL